MEQETKKGKYRENRKWFTELHGKNRKIEIKEIKNYTSHPQNGKNIGRYWKGTIVSESRTKRML